MSTTLEPFKLQLLLHLYLFTVAVLLSLPEKRNPSLFDQRLAWEAYCFRHEKRGTLTRRLRMTKESFDKLLQMVESSLLVKETYANMRGGPIIPALCLYCTLRWLAGGSYLDIADIAGISKSSFYRVIWKTITTLCQCHELKLKFPKTSQEVKNAAAGFSTISSGNAIANCVGVVDGYLLRIRVPSLREVKNIRSFFSGHYQCYGVNVQAVADHHSRFVFLAFAAPGVTGDRDAIRQCSLYDLVEALPNGFCVIGDAAYTATEHMVPIYSGSNKLLAKYDNFNFYASQMQIGVEMAFGMMQMKWGILQRPIGVSLANMSWLIQAVARLHNYCINERLAHSQEPFGAGVNAPHYVPSVPHGQNGDPVELEPAFIGTADGYSYLREFMVERVARLGLTRPGCVEDNGKSNKRRRTDK